jgi:hypothetical protein
MVMVIREAKRREKNYSVEEVAKHWVAKHWYVQQTSAREEE